jgi:hypothetical protein
VICDSCGHDSPKHHVKLVAFLRVGWPPIELSQLCATCRRELHIGLWNRLLLGILGVAVLVAIAAAGFGVVCLIQCLLKRGST